MKFTKILLTAPLAIAALSTPAFAADNSDDMSYSVGYSMGQNLKNQLAQGGVKVDNEQLEAGLSNGIKGETPKLTEDQMKQAMTSLQQQAMAAQKPQEK